MAGYIARILNNANSGLAAQQAVIANTAHNIANVNTPGYSRRTVTLETREGRGNAPGINIGAGVQVGSITQARDQYLDKLLSEASGEKYAASTDDEFMSRIESLFNLSGAKQTIGDTSTAFYNSLNDLSVNPSSVELRANVLERGQDLVTSIQQTYNGLASLQTEADSRISTEIQTVNSLTTQIASLNGLITGKEGGGKTGAAADERDQRNVLLNQLSEKIGYNSLELPDGSVTLTLPTGFALVSGINSRDLETTNQPSYSPGAMPPSLAGGALNNIVYDYDSGTGAEHFDLTQVISQGQGTIGALLKLRGVSDVTDTSPFQADGTLPALAARVESITRSLLSDFNNAYLGATDRDPGTPGFQASSGDLDGNSPTVMGFFTFNYTGNRDPSGDGRTQTTELDVMGITNFSSQLKLAFTDPRKIAAAVDSTTGAPLAPIFGSGDGRNAKALADLQNQTLSMNAGGFAGAFTFNGTYEQSYNAAITEVGNLAGRATTRSSVADANYTTAQTRQSEVSGVSLDEEFTSLIQFQKAYQASAKMIQVGQQLLDQILQIV